MILTLSLVSVADGYARSRPVSIVSDVLIPSLITRGRDRSLPASKEGKGSSELEYLVN
jgi:hypothetical protein